MFRGNVLCVSTDFDVCQSWQRHLQHAGFHVIAAPDPAEAFDCLEPERFDVLLLRDDVGRAHRDLLIANAQRCDTSVLMVGCVDPEWRPSAAVAWIATDAGAEAMVSAVERRMTKKAAITR